MIPCARVAAVITFEGAPDSSCGRSKSALASYACWISRLRRPVVHRGMSYQVMLGPHERLRDQSSPTRVGERFHSLPSRAAALPVLRVNTSGQAPGPG